MKRILVFMLCCLLCVGCLVGCRGPETEVPVVPVGEEQNNDKQDKQTEPSETPPVVPPIKLNLYLNKATEPFDSTIHYVDTYVGEVFTFDAKLFPENATDKSLSWVTTDQKVMSGVGDDFGIRVFALKEGKAYLFVSAANNVSVQITVVVNAVPYVTNILNITNFTQYLSIEPFESPLGLWLFVSVKPEYRLDALFMFFNVTAELVYGKSGTADKTVIAYLTCWVDENNLVGTTQDPREQVANQVVGYTFISISCSYTLKTALGVLTAVA